MELRVKICGLCRPQDAAVAAAAGATHVGVILVRESRRAQTLEGAARILVAAPGVARVGVFGDESVPAMVQAAEALELDVVQLHGQEAPGTVGAMREAGSWAVWKALRPRTRAEFERGVAMYGDVVDGFLLDGYDPGAQGGTGVRAPWSVLTRAREVVPPGVLLGLAGGLTPDNVGAAVREVGPDLVDVSSGVEASLCRKDAGLVAAFVAAARNAADVTTGPRGES